MYHWNVLLIISLLKGSVVFGWGHSDEADDYLNSARAAFQQTPTAATSKITTTATGAATTKTEPAPGCQETADEPTSAARFPSTTERHSPEADGVNGRGEDEASIAEKAARCSE